MNVGENKKRRLNRALQRFAAMLIEEALDLSGLPKARLAEALGITDDQVIRYTRLPGIKSSRAPQAAAVQQLENRVAKLLKRTAHTVIVQNNSKLKGENTYFTETIEGRPGDDLNLRDFDLGSYQLDYEGDWPTYRRLKNFKIWNSKSESIQSLIKRRATYEEWPEMLRLYAWQWGILWERGVPWLNRETFGVKHDAKIESFLPEMTENAMCGRRAFAVVGGFTIGRKMLDDFEQAMLKGDDDLIDHAVAVMITSSESIESIVQAVGAENVRTIVDKLV